MSMNNNFISNIILQEAGLPVPTPEIEHERNAAIYDILQENVFGLDSQVGMDVPSGPFLLNLSIRNSLLVFLIENEAKMNNFELHLSLSPLKPIIKDYFEICKSYFNAVKKLSPNQIEVIDMGRRGIHLEGARALIDRLNGKIKTDIPTAKRLFTLICALHFR